MSIASPHRVALLAVLLLLGVRDVVFCSTWADEPTPEKRQHGEDVAWTAIIPDAFPQNIYKWGLMADGAYTEDGFNRTTGATIQPTLSGRWTTKGTRMFLRQDGIHYVFDGKVAADRRLIGRDVAMTWATLVTLPKPEPQAARQHLFPNWQTRTLR
jgi:hypothetical protein